jgi:hypothetical protein
VDGAPGLIVASYAIQGSGEPTSDGCRHGSAVVVVPGGIEAMVAHAVGGAVRCRAAALVGDTLAPAGSRPSHRRDTQATATTAVAIPPPRTKSTPRSLPMVRPPPSHKLLAGVSSEACDGGARMAAGVVVRLTERRSGA